MPLSRRFGSTFLCGFSALTCGLQSLNTANCQVQPGRRVDRRTDLQGAGDGLYAIRRRCCGQRPAGRGEDWGAPTHWLRQTYGQLLAARGAPPDVLQTTLGQEIQGATPICVRAERARAQGNTVCAAQTMRSGVSPPEQMHCPFWTLCWLRIPMLQLGVAPGNTLAAKVNSVPFGRVASQPKGGKPGHTEVLPGATPSTHRHGATTPINSSGAFQGTRPPCPTRRLSACHSEVVPQIPLAPCVEG